MKIRKMNMKQLLTLVGILFMPFYSNSQTIYAEADTKYDGIERVEVEGRFADVKILGTGEDGVELKGIIRGKLRGSNDFEIKHRQEGTVLKVWIEAPRSIMGRFEAQLSFKVPYSMDVDITNSSGDIYIEEIVAEQMKLKATSGDIVIKNVESLLTTTTTSGDLEINYLKGAISATSTSGNQKFNHIRASVSTVATSGDLLFFDVVGDLSTRTTSGDLQFEGIDGSLSNVSTSGNLIINKAKTRLDLLTTSGDISGDEIELIGDSKFKSTSGDISIDFANDLDGMSFDLRASSGDLRAGRHSAEGKLYMKHGDVWVYGHSSSGDQNYR
ncbi:hypothetical protein DWB61_04465 [Ancylomarina euxinus]|uniref:DUF4097 domain-containing protein n=1 Tax=Ancylomarina euxinus TaxID=2283627 RepID=A0A425Y5G4_9BACT|nr:DUF4097 family beta strand repeat-containing protein [Ancylomarina euxinus]MCZ4694332.1 DUF4097 family beta strand repeat-containing protein [Ancylomarina euxinus]MUP14337.1 DUF4097 family beta strand repeat protein [Ancylomarina euxinus]RRG23650.1 hypothetical protein DWB61_04465 [Ancylomarina euxinus]